MPLLNRVSTTCARAIRSTGSSGVTKCSVSPLIIKNDHARPYERVVSAGSKSKSQSRAMATSADSLVAFGQQHVTRGLGRLTEAVMAKGEGSYVTFEDGRRMLDFSCGIGVTNLGHCHPKVSKAAADQCVNIVHAQCSISFHGPYLRLIEKLLPIMPDPSLDSFFFWNSGSEAIEASLKMARQITGRQNIIAMQGGYHGRTFGAMAVTKSKTVYSEGFFPLMPGVFAIPFPYWHQLGLPINTSEEELVRFSLYQLDLVLKQQTAPRDTAAIIVEPVLGEGGYVPAPASFLKGLRTVCDKHGILLIVDEVQSGFGRTGKYFNVEYSSVRPDILIIAKGLANGFPLSGVVSRKELTDKLVPGSMGGTYAGNAVSCAAAVAVANAFREEKVLDNVSARSSELLTSLKSLHDDPEVGSMVVDIRGQGLMIAVEFASPLYSSTDPALVSSAPKSLASRVAKRCMEKGLLILTTSIYEVIRFIPPLNISQGDLQKGCQIFAESVKEVIREG
ncbi:pyridoxal phosphate-dependent transferase [Suillus placidus]|uniref:Pyridoxal phosphate-dependent transferase n=1 Tax=Suillus placidus TaxID=48579 RepID=A0A9P6ZX20_9AGAM|nr:pyridoxal phosphate-dependent transferase [Suillus placidus]